MRGCVRRLEVRAFKVRVVAIDADPCKGIDDALSPLRLVARLVGVFDTQNEHAIVLQGKNPVVERRASTTDMEIPGG